MHDDEVRVVNESVRVSGANGVPENLMDVGNGFMRAGVNKNLRVNGGELTVHAEVHGVSPAVGGSTVSRGISPFDGQIEFPAAQYVATMSAATAGTTSTSLPHFAQPRTDLLRMTTTAQANMANRDPNARGPVYVVWQGRTQRVIEAPQISLAPSMSVPPAICVGAPITRHRLVETSTPYPPRRHEDDALRTSSDERYYTPSRGNSRYEPYSLTGRGRAGQAVRAVVQELGALPGEQGRADPRRA